MFTSKWLAGVIVALLIIPVSMASAARADDDHVRMGGDITISEDSSGDVVAIGGDITVDANVTGDVAAIGGDVTVRGTVSGDLAALGGSVTLEADVKGEVGTAGGTFTLGPRATVGGDVGLAAGDALIEGRIAGDLGAAGEEIVISGAIDGNVDIKAAKVVVSSGARIGGKLKVRGPNEPEIADGAVIEGGVEYSFSPPGAMVWEEFVAHGGLFFLIALGVASIAVIAGGALIVGLLLLFAFSGWAERTVQSFKGKPWSSLGLGLVIVVLVPLLILFLTVTIVGIPLAFILGHLYPVFLVLGFVGGGLGLSRLFSRGEAPSTGMKLLYLFLALLVMAVLLMIPIIGWLIITIVFFMGTGALTMALFSSSEGGAAAA